MDGPDKTVIEKVCEAIAGGCSQREACRQNNLNEGTFRLWKRTHNEVNTHYAYAREERANGWAEELVEIVDSVDTEGDPIEVANRLKHAHERLDARKWVISRINKDYREKSDLNITGDLTLSERLQRAREASPISE